jgi:hypothetical protein
MAPVTAPVLSYAQPARKMRGTRAGDRVEHQ